MSRSSNNKGNDIVVVEGVIQWVTDKGVKVFFDENENHLVDWLPKSQIKKCTISILDAKHVGQSATFLIPRWLAENKGVDYLEEGEWDEDAAIEKELKEKQKAEENAVFDFDEDDDYPDDDTPF